MSTAPVIHHNPQAPLTTIRTATGAQHTSTASAQLALPTLPNNTARHGHIIPGFTNNLLSLGQLCDEGCTAHFDKQGLRIINAAGTTILTGTREIDGARLWRVDITPPSAMATPATLIPPEEPLNAQLASPLTHRLPAP